MRIDVLTIFPEMFPPVLGASILKRATQKGILQVQLHDLRDFSRDKHRKVDDRPYGGGPGMVMRPEPFFEAVDDLKKQRAEDREQRTEEKSKPHVVLMSPQGEKLTQSKAEELSKHPWLILLCGHYEGVDERVRLGLAHEEVSIGDYVLTCGELPAMVLIDALTRLLPGALGRADSLGEESFQFHLLEYPQYTRPRSYRSFSVPGILLSGDARRVNVWRRLQALRRTFRERPDMIHESQNPGH